MVNTKGLDSKCTEVLLEGMFFTVLMYSSKLWCGIRSQDLRCILIDNLDGVFGLRRINKMRNLEEVRE